MARVETDDAQRVVVVDLHGYSVETALEVARTKLREAWENGYSYVKLIHGASRSRRPSTTLPSGYGGIKWGLRSALERGEWMAWVYSLRRRKHTIDEVSMTLALRPNPAPWEPLLWTETPEPEFAD